MLKGLTAMACLRHIFFCSILTLRVGLAASTEFAFLRNVDFDQPFCEGAADLSAAREVFITIANDLPGREAYNDLIRVFHLQDWEKLDKGIGLFNKVYETSPLREAVRFLDVQAKFDRIDRVESDETKEAEKSLKELLLLYPKSTLAPGMVATVGAFWLKHRNFQRSLALFEQGRQEYPFHPLNCTFQFGVAENYFLMHEWDGATRILNQIIQKCDSVRLKVGAELKLAEMLLSKNPRAAGEKIELTYNAQSNIVSRFYPNALYNLGEYKYRQTKYPAAAFFFNEYLGTGKMETECRVYALKRLADVAFHNKKNLPEVIGLYLSAHEVAPLSDIGQFSRVHALLLELKDVPSEEFERRIRVIDEHLEKIGNSEIQGAGYLEKGLVLLDMGEKSALAYLVRLNERKELNLQKGDLAIFVRDRLLKILETQASGVLDKRIKSDSRKDKEIFDPIEEAYAIWIKGSEFEKKAQKLYGQFILQRFDQSFEARNYRAAFEKLERWKRSPLWVEKNLSLETKTHIGGTIAKFGLLANPAEMTALSSLIAEKEEFITPFLKEVFPELLLTAFLYLKNEEKLKVLYQSYFAGRKTASVKATLPVNIQDILWWRRGLILGALKKYAEAEQVLLKVRKGDVKQRANLDRVGFLLEAKKYQKGFEVGTLIYPKLSNEKKLELLKHLRLLVSEGKLWRNGIELLVLAQDAGVEGTELATYQFIAGRSQAELGQCLQAVENYQSALTLDKESKEMIEARFRMAKCLVRIEKPERARQLWEEVVKLNDNFWSPLAKNELQLLDK